MKMTTVFIYKSTLLVFSAEVDDRCAFRERVQTVESQASVLSHSLTYFILYAIQWALLFSSEYLKILVYMTNIDSWQFYWLWLPISGWQDGWLLIAPHSYCLVAHMALWSAKWMFWCKCWCALFPRDNRVHVHDPCAAVLWFVCHGCEIHFMAVDLKNIKVKAFKPVIVKVWFLVPWESPDHSRVFEGQSYFFFTIWAHYVLVFFTMLNLLGWLITVLESQHGWGQWSWYTPVTMTTAYSLHMKEWEKNRTSLMKPKAVSFYYCYP